MSGKQRGGEVSDDLPNSEVLLEAVDQTTMDLDYENFVYHHHQSPSSSATLDISDVVIGTDLKEIVDSICKEEGFPDSPPDSGSEHLMSPGSAPGFSSSRVQGCYTNLGANLAENYSLDQQQPTSYNSSTIMPDLSKVSYALPLQMIESPDEDFKQIINVQGTSVMYSDLAEPSLKRRRSDEDSVLYLSNGHKNVPRMMKNEPSEQIIGSPACSSIVDSSMMMFPNAIKFAKFLPDKWFTMANARLQELAAPSMTITADKGFNYSGQDEAFIVQKKNHFQVTCDLFIEGSPRFIKKGADHHVEISHLQISFYGVKSDIPTTHIKIEQSQADRTKREFNPLKIELAKASGSFQVTVGRLHFAETTTNNMRKKGKPNPAQKYFQLVVAIEAVGVGVNGKPGAVYDVARMASEKVIVRASNPGQFESDNDPPWTRDPTSETVYHLGRVAINTDQGSEALTVHGNIQVSGQVMQPSDARIKHVLREVDCREQLANVNKIRIVQFKYRPEFVHQLPEDEQCRLDAVPHTGIIAQDIQKVIPDAVTSSGAYILSNGEEIKDMLTVNKDRLFLENLGAVRELSNITGHLGHRVEDLEKANESVAVKLSKLGRVGSAKSCSSSLSSEFEVNFKQSRQRRHSSSNQRRSSLVQSKGFQWIFLSLMALIAVSLVAIATMYIIDYHHRVLNDDLTHDANHSQTETTAREDNKIMMTKTSTTSTMATTQTILLGDHLAIGSLNPDEELACASAEISSDKCQSYCCSTNSRTFNSSSFQDHHQQSNGFYLNEVFLVEPASAVESASSSITETTTKESTPEDVEKKLLELLSANHFDKHNQVIDDVSKPSTSTIIETTIDSKEDKDKSIKADSSTEKATGIKKVIVLPKSAKKENDNEVDDEQTNEVFDDHFDKTSGNNNQSAESNSTTNNDLDQPQRAKRSIQEPSETLTLTSATVGNVSLDQRFCDRDVTSTLLNECLAGFGFNVSLSIPLSVHLRDAYVSLKFGSGFSRVVMCPVDPEPLVSCSEEAQYPELAVLQSDEGFQVNIGLFDNIKVKFRMMKRLLQSRPPSDESVRSLCSLSPSKIGVVFREFNLKFYRLCQI